MADRPEIGYYYPAPFWTASEGSWVKSLLLFFDRLAILLPDYMHGRHAAADPSLVEPLEDQGLLQVLEPKEWIDNDMAHMLATVIIELLAEGYFDDLPSDRPFDALSRSRMGYGANIDLADWLVDELRAKGLARPTEDGVSIPLHPIVRTTILVVLAQLARISGERHDLLVHPVTSHDQAVTDLVRTLSREPLPSAGHVVAFDLEPVTLSLHTVPLDEVLAFRADHGPEHKAYLRDMRRFTAELATIDDEAERETLLLDRQQELSDAAHALRRAARQGFRKDLAAWSLGVAGAVWDVTQKDPLGLALAGVGALVELLPGKPDRADAYSYLFAVQRQFSHA